MARLKKLMTIMDSMNDEGTTHTTMFLFTTAEAFSQNFPSKLGVHRTGSVLKNQVLATQDIFAILYRRQRGLVVNALDL